MENLIKKYFKKAKEEDIIIIVGGDLNAKGVCDGSYNKHKRAAGSGEIDYIFHNSGNQLTESFHPLEGADGVNIYTENFQEITDHYPLRLELEIQNEPYKTP